MFYVYILESFKDLSYYIGQCDDLDVRMSKHFDGMSKYTASKRPLKLRYFEKCYTVTSINKKQLFIAWIDSDSPWIRETFDP